MRWNARAGVECAAGILVFAVGFACTSESGSTLQRAAGIGGASGSPAIGTGGTAGLGGGGLGAFDTGGAKGCGGAGCPGPVPDPSIFGCFTAGWCSGSYCGGPEAPPCCTPPPPMRTGPYWPEAPYLLLSRDVTGGRVLIGGFASSPGLIELTGSDGGPVVARFDPAILAPQPVTAFAPGLHLLVTSRGDALPAFTGEIVVPPVIHLKSYPAGWKIRSEHLFVADAGTSDSGLRDAGRGSDAAASVDAAPSLPGDFVWEPDGQAGFVELHVTSTFAPDFTTSHGEVFCRAPLSQGRFDSAWPNPYGDLTGSLRVVILSHASAGTNEVQLASEETIAAIP